MKERTSWWRRRTLHTRLSLMVACAVAAAVVVMAGAALLTVAALQAHQLEASLSSDARTIAASPAEWEDIQEAMPKGYGGHKPLGPTWQLLDSGGAIVSGSAEVLPVTPAAKEIAAGGRPRWQEEVIIDGDHHQMLTVAAKGGGAVQVAINQERTRDLLTLLAAALAAACVLGIAGAAWLGRVVARAGLAPVEKLTGAVEQVAVTMDLTKPVEVSGADEVARLGRSVNTMLAAIDSARRAQRTLVEDAGHELRTPLTSIRTNVELLLEVERRPELAHRLPPEERESLLQDLDSQVRELATLTTELVELAREETTREAVEPVELQDVVTAAATRVRTRAPGLTFTTDLTAATVRGRPGELERMVVNILDNAAKWSPAGGTVRTSLRADGPHWWTLTVADEGPGIAAEDLPHVFDRFYRAPAARSMPGSGLGLAIVAQTAAQHGGTVTAAANEPHGTVVTVRLPNGR
ncbi:two-component sensor histidine kinase [Paractinoplanes deccanensis]|uniref:histidine kinase n=1 Tax=Paractinoplanes deccanensis TaxID=113561 RepID=A0ABQ3Y411_9ACTN|nr:HAMP domain-containing sensor histidine kinase [Actinoplanes deccanensis]GID74690.1 two-component sensor histidine kinase [Actinoplanes deccanensis]